MVALTVASSSTRILLGVNNARASETSWRWPWLRLDPVIVLIPRPSDGYVAVVVGMIAYLLLGLGHRADRPSAQRGLSDVHALHCTS